MITAEEIRKKAERKYIEYLRSVVAGAIFEPIVIICDKKASRSLELYQKEFADIISLSKEKKGYGYTIEWKKVKTRSLGEQDLPDKVLFDSANDFERFLNKVGEVSRFRKDIALIRDNLPMIEEWIERYPQKVVDNTHCWNDLLRVVRYFISNPQPNLYIRELPIEVHTKFIEQNKSILKELLDIVIADHICKEETMFEKRYGLRYDEPWVRFRILDDAIATRQFSGVTDIQMPQSQFCNLTLTVNRIFVVENKINFLTFPLVKDAMVIWGHGFSVGILKDISGLNNTSLYYWGDIDAQGFEILSQFRSYFPNTYSLLMTRSIFEAYYEKDAGTPSNVRAELNLTEEEYELYEFLKSNNYRLEQEKIPQTTVNKTICKLLKNSNSNE